MKLLLLGLGLSCVLFGVQLECVRKGDGAATVLRFDSSVPALQEAGLSLLSLTEACGVGLSFSENCAGDLIEQEGQYNYSFRCDEVYGDLYFTGLQNGYAEFRCSGEKVKPKFAHLEYSQCRVFNSPYSYGEKLPETPAREFVLKGFAKSRS